VNYPGTGTESVSVVVRVVGGHAAHEGEFGCVSAAVGAVEDVRVFCVCRAWGGWWTRVDRGGRGGDWRKDVIVVRYIFVDHGCQIHNNEQQNRLLMLV
jgi:hypothetical protein